MSPTFPEALLNRFVQNLTWMHISQTTTTVYRLCIPYNPGKPAPEELSETLTQYTTLTVLKFFTSTPNLPSQASLYSWKKHKEQEDNNLHFIYTCLVLDLMRLLVNRWSTLTHASHSMTTRSSHTDESESKPIHATQRICPSCRNSSYFRARGPAQTMLACISRGQEHPPNVIIYSKFYVSWLMGFNSAMDRTLLVKPFTVWETVFVN